MVVSHVPAEEKALQDGVVTTSRRITVQLENTTPGPHLTSQMRTLGDATLAYHGLQVLKVPLQYF